MHPNDEGKLIVDLELEKFNILVGKLHELNNNWNELKKWLEEAIEEQEKIWRQREIIYSYKNILYKMQELEGNNETRD